MAVTAEKTITIKSPAFEEGKAIPKKFASDGENISPELMWANVPNEAKELVLMMEDPDGTGGNFSHWLVYNISPKSTGLPEGVEPKERVDAPVGILQGKNSFAKIGYGGPLPAPGSGVHRYHFRLFALDARLNLKPGADKEEVQSKMYGHVIAHGDFVGTYKR